MSKLKAFAVIMLTALSITAVSTRAATANEAQNKLTIENAFQAWAKGTGGPYALLAENARWTIAGNSMASKEYPTREAFMREVIGPFNARMSKPLKPKIVALYAEGDTVIVQFDAEGLATDGLPYKNTYAWFLKMQEGHIVTATAFFDSIAFDELWTRIRLD